MNHQAFQVAFWVVSICFALFGLIVTIAGWKVNAKNARILAKTKDIHDAVDTCIAALMDLEDSAYSFWLTASTSTSPHQLIVGHARLVMRLKQLNNLNSLPLPSSDLIILRRFCTLDSETKNAPLNSDDTRIKQISKAATDILQSEILQKNWS